MAKFTPLRTFSGKLTDYSPTPKTRQLIQWSLDFRRALILANKPVAKSQNSPSVAFNIEGTNNAKPDRYDSMQVGKDKNTGYHNPISDGIVIVVLQPWGNMKAFEEIRLPFIPSELEYNVESSFTAIRPIGSNTAKYHYTGAEDRLEFEIDWHSFEENREDVIMNCRKLESLSKGDGYNAPPPSVMLVWGKNNLLFADHEFAVISAPYRLTQFSKSHLSNGVLRNTHLLPIQAYQKVTFARVSSNNLTAKDIQYSSNY
jgi:hypothetical protein